MRNFWTVVGVIAAVVIAWFIVDLALRAVAFVLKFGLVAIVAVVVFFVLRWFFGRGRDRDGQTP